MARYNPALQAIPSLGQVGVLALGGWLAIAGSITLGTFVAFSSYLIQLVGPVRALAALVTTGQEARASVIRVFEVIDSQPDVTDRPGARPTWPRTRPAWNSTTSSFGYLPGAAGAARAIAARRARRDGRPGRRVRLGQVHHRAAAAPLLRPAGRLGPDRRVQRGGRDAGIAARRDRPGDGGQLPVLRHGDLQHRLRPAGRQQGTRSSPRPRPPRRTSSSPSCRRATTPLSGNRA